MSPGPGSGPGDRLGVCLLLHAAAGDQRAPFERLRLHHHLAQAVGAGRVGPFALAAADGRGSDWRPAPGDDPFGMLLDELLPLLSGLGLHTGPGQVAVLGWSMGAAGALRLAEAHPDRLAAVVVASLAVDPAGAEVADAGRLTGLQAKADCGANDPFADATRALAAALPTAEAAVTKGCHDGRFWQHLAPAQLRDEFELQVAAGRRLEGAGDFERLVLTEGDGNAIHMGRKSEPGLTGSQITPAAGGEDEWRRWLRDHGIDWDGEVA